ncbi:MAG: hypothetical protein ABIG89_03820 [Candidatus Woesearchaeota archaeon]
MVEQTVFGNVIVFMEKLGVYDIILPFLLVFTVIFAVFEKTRVFGTEEVEGVKYSKKNLNAMVAFVIAFLVVASSQLVSIINKSLSRVVLLILLMICFLVLIGTFFSEGEEVIFEKGSGWRTFFMVVLFIAILLIFMSSIDTKSGGSWLSNSLDYLKANFSNTGVSAVVLIVVILIFMLYIIAEPKAAAGKKKKEEH